ncbi:hypothetical protein BOO71_0005869 [Deinococcus marmoris]|uniref:Uncharacterized protein n=1 Tax=Deinococcus marmoris TaxID=249408 RepID=A0A1U7NZT5_9DEIO|nr:hypothetical protein BOO71_0005869 [Deinococcus marmoris]
MGRPDSAENRPEGCPFASTLNVDVNIGHSIRRSVPTPQEVPPCAP